MFAESRADAGDLQDRQKSGTKNSRCDPTAWPAPVLLSSLGAFPPIACTYIRGYIEHHYRVITCCQISQTNTFHNLKVLNAVGSRSNLPPYSDPTAL